MGVALAAEHFGANHAVRCVLVLLNNGGIRWRREAGPPAAGVKLGIRREQWLSATNAFVRSRRLCRLILPRKRWLGSLLPRHMVLIRRELLLPLGFALLYFLSHKYLP